MSSAVSPLLQKHLIADLPSPMELMPYLERMDKERWYTNFGPLATEFEGKIKQLISVADPHPENGAVHVTTMATCFHALEAGLRLLDVPRGGKVLLPAVSFPACPLAVLHAGGEPLLCDVDADSWVLTPDIARDAAQHTNLAAVMPLALYGIPLPVEGWNQFTRDTGIPVIIDAAAAIESQAIPHKGIVAHSLHATKPFGVGEGGVLVARDQELIHRAKVYSNFGTVERIAYGDGTNAKLSEYHAGVGLAQLKRWVGRKSKRRAVLDLYRQQLAPMANAISFHPGLDQAVTSLFMLRLGKPIACDVLQRGKEEGMAFHHTYLPPLYHHPYFMETAFVDEKGQFKAGDTALEIKKAHMKHSEWLQHHIVGVPFHPFLGEKEVVTVVEALRRFAEI